MKLKFTIACLAAMMTTPLMAADGFKIQDIRIEGLERTDPITVFSYLPISVGDTFTDTKGEQTIKGLYATGFFDDIQIETQKNLVLITVTERPMVSHVTITGSKLISAKDVQESLARAGLGQGRIYDPILMNHAVEMLKQEYLARGKNQAVVEPILTKLERNRVGIEIKVDEGPTTVIREINFTGNQFFSSYRLRQQMKLSTKGLFTWISKADRFDPKKFSADLDKITQLYQDHGFFAFQITHTDIKPSEKYPQDLALEIGIDEGERYTFGDIRLIGDGHEVSTDELESMIKIKRGSWFNASELKKLIERLNYRMGEAGYALNEITTIPQVQPGNVVDFDLHMEAHHKVYVREIHITGNNKTRDEVIRRELRQLERAPFDQAKIDRSKERIQLLGYFTEANITPQPVAGAPDQVDLDVNVTEQPTGSINVRIGYAQDDGLVFSGELAQDNVVGTGKRISARATTGGSTKVASLSFTDPYFTADGVSLGYDIFWRTYDPNKIDISAYKTKTYGTGLRLGVPVTEYDKVYFGLGVNNMKISLFDKSPQRYRDFVQKYGASNWTLTGNVGWGRNTTDSTLWPTRGYIISANVEGGLPGGDIQYYKLTHDQHWFFPLNQDLTLSLSGQVGYASGYGNRTKQLPFFHNFYGGGLSFVRGYDNGSLGPKSYDGQGGIDYLGGTRQASASAELLFPMPGLKDNKTIRLSLFADAGSVWDDRYYNQKDYQHYADGYHSTFKNELRYSAGLALTWVSPIGPIKMSYAYPIQSKKGDEIQRFQFQLGTVF